MRDKEIQVRLRPDKKPRKDLDHTIDYYDATLHDLAKDVGKLCRVIELAYWNHD